MNVELLRTIQKHIREEPRRLRMAAWARGGPPNQEGYVESGYGEEDHVVFPPCGTVACIAGWAHILSGGGIGSAGQSAGARALDVDFDTALFFVDLWPADLEERYESAATDQERAEVACEAIDRFIAGDFL